MNLFVLAATAIATLGGADAAVIAHDAVVPFAQPTPNTTIQTVALQFKPQIYINNGCHPYPAVDKDGNTSGGLKPTGSQSAGCKGSGYGSQVYGRAVEYEGVYAFMYSWYMPKDETLDGVGHRHDWENCVVWLDSLDKNPSVVALSASYHSSYLYYYPPDSDYLDGDSAKIEYSTSWIVLDHSLSATSTSGETQDLIMWDQLTDAARTALEDTDFGNANVPFKEGNFATKVAKAYYA